MANDVVKFVDSIASSPTTRLDLNDSTTFTLAAAVLAPPPQIQSSVSSNAMTDGGYQSASRYGYRVIHLELILNVATQDLAATALQNLHRELDRETNYLKWQPDTATKPVFFKTWRTSPLQIVDQPAARAVYYVTLEIPAEPFALGLRETVSVGTVNNDPAAGSNGCYFDITGVIGDVAAPAILSGLGGRPNMVLGVRRHGTVTNLTTSYQAESMSLGVDTTNPGGAADAAMSGSGTTNYVRTSFATATMQTRVGISVTTDSAQAELAGAFRVFAVVRRSSAIGDINLTWLNSQPARQGATVATQLTTTRQVVDLGVVDFTAPRSTLYPLVNLSFQAERTSGASTLDWDYVTLVPADEELLIYSTATTGQVTVVDGDAEAVYSFYSGGSLFSAADLYNLETEATGGFPNLSPNQTNRFVFFKYDASTPPFIEILKADTCTSVAVDYYPRYLHVRPSTT